jgi:hypothetical protein
VSIAAIHEGLLEFVADDHIETCYRYKERSSTEVPRMLVYLKRYHPYGLRQPLMIHSALTVG